MKKVFIVTCLLFNLVCKSQEINLGMPTINDALRYGIQRNDAKKPALVKEGVAKTESEYKVVPILAKKLNANNFVFNGFKIGNGGNIVIKHNKIKILDSLGNTIYDGLEDSKIVIHQNQKDGYVSPQNIKLSMKIGDLLNCFEAGMFIVKYEYNPIITTL